MIGPTSNCVTLRESGWHAYAFNRVGSLLVSNTMKPTTNTEPSRVRYAISTAAEGMWGPTASCLGFAALTCYMCVTLLAAHCNFVIISSISFAFTVTNLHSGYWRKHLHVVEIKWGRWNIRLSYVRLWLSYCVLTAWQLKQLKEEAKVSNGLAWLNTVTNLFVVFKINLFLRVHSFSQRRSWYTSSFGIYCTAALLCN